MRERALELDALTVVPTVEVTSLDVEDGAIKRVRTTGGDIESDIVVIACGVWSPKLAAMAGAHIPLTPAVHQMISVGPVPVLADKEGEISYPIVRDMDTFCYERQHGADMEVGSVRASGDPARPGVDPVDRAGKAVADRAAVHVGGLRPATRRGTRADARHPR